MRCFFEMGNPIFGIMSRASKAAKTKLLIAKAKDAGLTDEELDALLEKAISKKGTKTDE